MSLQNFDGLSDLFRMTDEKMLFISPENVQWKKDGVAW